MTRLLGLMAVAVALWMFLELGLARLKKALGEGKPRPQGKPEITESLVRCSGCGVHVPRRQMVSGRCERCRT